jgi:formylglycine-generating enzyme required for sulfatase activity
MAPIATPTTAEAALSPPVASQPPPRTAAPPQTLRDQITDGGPALVGVPGGSFRMGYDRDVLAPEETPAHPVQVPPVYIGRDEVTFAEYDRFARATGRPLPSDQGWGRGQRPVINVSWNDAQAYTAWMSGLTGKRYRLPSEAEWEYAARAGTESFFWWGNILDSNLANCFDCGSQWDNRSTAPVGSFAANPFGLRDTAGNVMEWVADCYHDSYEGAPADGSAWTSGSCNARVARGGAFSKPSAAMHASRRSSFAPDTRLGFIGFRVVREP